MELLNSCVLWYTGRSETNLGFPIMPVTVVVTPTGSWSNDLSLGNNKILKTFDGSTNYISLTDNAAWDLWTGTNATCCVWIKYANITSFKTIIQQKEDLDTYWYISGVPGISKLTLVGRATDASYAFYYECPFTQSSDTWYHVTIVKSGSSCLMYINGVPQPVTATQTWSALSCNATLDIGLYATTYYAGNIKDLMLYGRALTQVEITTLMRMTNPTTGREFELLYPGIRGVE